MSDIKMIMFVEYLKLHKTSLIQDAEKLQKLMDDWQGDLDSDDYRDLEIADTENTGELNAVNHLLSVAHDILEKTH